MSLGLKDVDFGDHGVIYITSDKDRPFLTEWTKPATAEFLQVLPKQFDLFSRGKVPSKRRLFDNCSRYLEEKGYNYTSAQCENKWKSLKRRYLTKYEKLLTGKPESRKVLGKPRQMFDDEIETVLKIEKPSFKREMDEVSKINLNIPPGFSHKQEEEDYNEVDEPDEEFENYEEHNEHKYTQNDAKLIEMVLQDTHSMDEESLKDNKNNVFANSIEYLFSNPEDEAEASSAEEKYNPHAAGHSSDDRLVKEVKELRKVIKRSVDANTNLLKTHNATHEQILICLDSLDKREEEKLEIKKQKLDKQGELVQQVKIQNSLIAKLIQKFGNSNTNNSTNR